MPLEVETKFLVSCKHGEQTAFELEKAMINSAFRLIEQKIIHIHDTYFDTKDYLFLKQNSGLRLRKYNAGRSKLTLKESVPTEQDGRQIMHRIEIEGDASPALLHKIFESSSVLPEITSPDQNDQYLTAKEVRSFLEKQGLQPKIDLFNRRVEFTMASPENHVLAVAFDSVHCIGKQSEGRFCEVEIEILKGNSEAIAGVTSIILQNISQDLKASTKHKYLLALEKTGLYKKLKKKWLKENTTLWQKQFQEIRKRILHLYPKAITFKNPGHLHQTRVAIRQLLTLISVIQVSEERLKHVPDKLQFIYSESKTIQSLLGKVRDLDVIESQLIHKEKENPHGFEAFLIKMLQKERDTFRLKCLSELPERRVKTWTRAIKQFYTKLLPDLLDDINTEYAINKLQEQFINQYAIFSTLRKELGEYHMDTVKSLHKVRIRAKRLRYSYQYLGFALHESVEQEIKKFEDIQTQLGELNDLYNLDQLLIRLSDTYGSLLTDAFTAYRASLQVEFRKQMSEATDLLDAYLENGIPHASQAKQQVTHSTRTFALDTLPGLGPTIEAHLRKHHISDLRDLATLTRKDLDNLDAPGLNIPARARKHNWIAQAKLTVLQNQASQKHEQS